MIWRFPGSQKFPVNFLMEPLKIISLPKKFTAYQGYEDSSSSPKSPNVFLPVRPVEEGRVDVPLAPSQETVQRARLADGEIGTAKNPAN